MNMIGEDPTSPFPSTQSQSIRGAAAQERAAPFLEYVSGQLTAIRCRLEDFQSALGSSGFHGPPEEAKKLVDADIGETYRSSIINEMNRIERLQSIVEHQLRQLL
jgi:hypothetical protein